MTTCNPFNIRYNKRNKWLGQIGSYKGFCRFKDDSFGIRAAILLVRNYIIAGYNTPARIITRFAPLSDNNDTDAYISFVCSPAKDSFYIDRDQFVSAGSLTFYILLSRMAFIESRSHVSVETLMSINSRFNIINANYL